MPAHYSTDQIIVPATFPRATRLSTVQPTDKLKLACGLYTSSYDGIDGITIFFCHANGFCKELYEPYFDELYESLENAGVYLKYILAIDAVNHGASYALNEGKIGPDVRWRDFWNDVVSTFYYLQSNNHPVVQLPVFGMGHSFGGAAIFGSASINQKMFVSVTGIDAVIGTLTPTRSENLANMTFTRNDKWPSLEVAREKLTKSEMVQSFDPRVRELYFKHAFRPLPTLKYPNEKGVTLATPVTSEMSTFIPLPVDLRAHADEVPYVQFGGRDAFHSLHYVKVPKLLILGSIGRDFYRNYLETYGHDKSFHYVKAQNTHLIPLENPAAVAGPAAKFIAQTYATWKSEQKEDLKTSRPVDFHPLYKKHYAPITTKFKRKRAQSPPSQSKL